MYIPCKLRRDKYEPKLKLYWVDTKIHGIFEESNSELFAETSTHDTDAGSLTVGGFGGGFNPDEPLQLQDESEDGEMEEEEDDDDDAPRKGGRRLGKAEEEQALEALWVSGYLHVDTLLL